jgi:hypothetical protein
MAGNDAMKTGWSIPAPDRISNAQQTGAENVPRSISYVSDKL